MRWRRFRRWAKWACTGAVVLALVVAVAARFFRCYCQVASSDGTRGLLITERRGLLDLTYTGLNGHRPPVFLHDEAGAERFSGWDWGTGGHSSDRVHGPWHAGVMWVDHWSERSVGVNLMYPVLLTAIPAALLWYAERRHFGPGRCAKCGYERRGLAVDAKCPECGAVPTR